MKRTVIDNFHSKGFEWLSNFFPAPVVYRGVNYNTVEHAYQAAKTLVLAEREQIRMCSTPGKAKRLGREVTMRPDWDKIKLTVMLHLLRQKFNIPELRDKLLATGDIRLIEGNTWGDTFWGVCNRTGMNHLGRLLMQVRSELRGQMDMFDEALEPQKEDARWVK